MSGWAFIASSSSHAVDGSLAADNLGHHVVIVLSQRLVIIQLVNELIDAVGTAANPGASGC
jgi:hypothetical protein